MRDEDITSDYMPHTGQVVQYQSADSPAWRPAVVMQTRSNGTLDLMILSGPIVGGIMYWNPPPKMAERWRYPDDQGNQGNGEILVSTRSPQSDGYNFATALRTVFGDPRPNSGGAVMALARRFAMMSGYQGAEQAMDYMEGFIDAMHVELAAPDYPALPSRE